MGGTRTTGEFWTKHAMERRDRYPELGLTEDDLALIVRGVLDDKTGTLMKRNGNGWGYLYTLRGVRMAVVIDPDQRLIITFLPGDYYKSGSMVKRKQWRSRTDRPLPPDFSSRKSKSRNGGYGVE